MLARRDLTEAVCVFRTNKGEYELVNAGWPKSGAFSMALIQREPYIRIRRDHIDVKLKDARGIYRITERDMVKGVLIGELVYEEGPE